MQDERDLPARTRDEMIELSYLQGSSLREIAVAFELSHEGVRQVLRKRGVALRSTKARELDGAVRSLRMQG